MDDLRSESQSITGSLGMDAYFVVIAVNTLLKTLLASKEIYGTVEFDRSEGKWSHSEKVSATPEPPSNFPLENIEYA